MLQRDVTTRPTTSYLLGDRRLLPRQFSSAPDKDHTSCRYNCYYAVVVVVAAAAADACTST